MVVSARRWEGLHFWHPSCHPTMTELPVAMVLKRRAIHLTWLAGSCPSQFDSIDSLPYEAAHSTYWAQQMGNGEDQHSQSTGPESPTPSFTTCKISIPILTSQEEKRSGLCHTRHLITLDWDRCHHLIEPSFRTPLFPPGLTGQISEVLRSPLTC